MSTRANGLYAILALPRVYTFFQNLLGGESARKIVAEQYLRIQPGNRVLDIGCGPADFLSYFPEDIEYVGFDMNLKYIEAAQKKYGSRGKFYCQLLEAETLNNQEPYDVVLAGGLLHHLDDNSALHLLKLAASALKPNGRLVTTDGCYIDRQPFLAKLLIRMDRGTHVRTLTDYKALAQSVFPVVNCKVRQDLLRLPYTHLFMECQRSPQPEAEA